MMAVIAAYQGERGSYSEIVALEMGPRSLPCPTFADCLQAVDSRRADVAILPVENSTEGSVGEANDLLFDTTLEAVGERYVHVRHCLIGTGTESDVRTVYSHPQALGQCRRFIGDRERIPVSDTSGAVRMLKDINRDDAAAIASMEAARLHGMPVIRYDINDVSANYTRFLLLGRGRPEPSGSDKTTVVFRLPHEPGSLCRALSTIKYLNMTRIESRPVRTGSWEYGFVVDILGHRDGEAVSDSLRSLQKSCLTLSILGSYPLAGRPAEKSPPVS